MLHLDKYIVIPYNITCFVWGRSSPGRALEWHSRGSRFDPDRLHQNKALWYTHVVSATWVYAKSFIKTGFPVNFVAEWDFATAADEAAPLVKAPAFPPPWFSSGRPHWLSLWLDGSIIIPLYGSWPKRVSPFSAARTWIASVLAA